jgi:16S rRNA (guanine966-N2)-methyltransferase
VRVIAGTLKGRRLESPDWDGLRPTSDKLRETLFNVLAPRIVGARVLDGYAGTGAVGIEALSRGAAQVVFVDRDARARALIAANLARCGIAGGCAIIRASFDASGGSDVFSNTFNTFNIVLLDPPYDDSPEQVLADTAVLTAPAGLLVLEHARRRTVPDEAAGLRRTRQIRSGDSMLSFYE